MPQTLKEVMSEAFKAQQKMLAEDAKAKGVKPEQLLAHDAAQAEYEKRRAAILRSGIMVTRTDVDMIAAQRSKRTAAVDDLATWLGSKDTLPICLLCGQHGTGKTFAAAVAIASAATGYVVKAHALGRLVNPTWNEVQTGHERIDLRHSLIVLDDLGAEAQPKHPRWSESLFEFLEHRALYGRTIITTNLRANQLVGRYDGRSIERLDANSHVIELSGESMRKRGGLR